MIRLLLRDLDRDSGKHDSRGRRTSATDQNTKTTIYTYDDADRLVSVKDPDLPPAFVHVRIRQVCVPPSSG